MPRVNMDASFELYPVMMLHFLKAFWVASSSMDLVKTMLSMVGRKISVSSLPWECQNEKKMQ